jgi:hypothetical protein
MAIPYQFIQLLPLRSIPSTLKHALRMRLPAFFERELLGRNVVVAGYADS